MVAIIKTSASIRRALAYNENKVKQEVARCLAAVNYPKDAADLSFSQKLNRLARQAALNERVTRSSVHISLNFDPSEKLSSEQLIGIAQAYMDKIGFGEQPYLVYEHQDAAHPHIHITSINIRSDGSRIDMFNIGRNQSEKARKEIEKVFGLVPASGPRQKAESKISPTPEPVSVPKAIYGKDQTKKAIETVLDFVLKNYRYTSLAELNAVLGRYNVLADRGSENSQVFRTKGLMYRLLDQKGNRVGVPIKASELKGRPTLRSLESRFALNRLAREPYQIRLRTRIDWILTKPDLTLDSLGEALAKEGIDLVLQRSAQGMLYGITYIDHQSRCVFKGSDLGKSYSAKAIGERCGRSFFQKQISLPKALTQSSSSIPWKKDSFHSLQLDRSRLLEKPFDTSGKAVLTEHLPASFAALITPAEPAIDYVPAALKRTGRKRKKRRMNHSPDSG